MTPPPVFIEGVNMSARVINMQQWKDGSWNRDSEAEVESQTGVDVQIKPAPQGDMKITASLQEGQEMMDIRELELELSKGERRVIEEDDPPDLSVVLPKLTPREIEAIKKELDGLEEGE